MDTGRNKQIPHPESDSAGRVVIDSRGRNVWRWNDDQLDSTSILLKRLDNAELALEPTRQLRRPDAASAGKATDAPAAKSPSKGSIGPGGLQIEQTFSIKLGGGFDPYNRS
jgi:hypothetical protein